MIWKLMQKSWVREVHLEASSWPFSFLPGVRTMPRVGGWAGKLGFANVPHSANGMQQFPQCRPSDGLNKDRVLLETATFIHNPANLRIRYINMKKKKGERLEMGYVKKGLTSVDWAGPPHLNATISDYFIAQVLSIHHHCQCHDYHPYIIFNKFHLFLFRLKN